MQPVIPYSLHESAKKLSFSFYSAIAFVVPLHDQEEENQVKKQPPKRLLQLEEQQTSPPVLTHKMLQDKLAEAEQRRMQVRTKDNLAPSKYTHLMHRLNVTK